MCTGTGWEELVWGFDSSQGGTALAEPYSEVMSRTRLPLPGQIGSPGRASSRDTDQGGAGGDCPHSCDVTLRGWVSCGAGEMFGQQGGSRDSACPWRALSRLGGPLRGSE